MNGKEGMLANVGNLVSRPLSPLEHATEFIEPLLLSNLGSYVARKGEGVGREGPEGGAGVGGPDS